MEFLNSSYLLAAVAGVVASIVAIGNYFGGRSRAEDDEQRRIEALLWLLYAALVIYGVEG